jgi:hypothetical protein
MAESKSMVVSSGGRMRRPGSICEAGLVSGKIGTGKPRNIFFGNIGLVSG